MAQFEVMRRELTVSAMRRFGQVRLTFHVSDGTLPAGDGHVGLVMPKRKTAR